MIATERVPCNLPANPKTGEVYHYKRVIKLLLANGEEVYCCTDCGHTDPAAMKVRAHVACHTYYRRQGDETEPRARRRPSRQRQAARREETLARYVEDIIESPAPIDDDEGDGGEITAADLLNIINEVGTLRDILAATAAERDDLRHKLTAERLRSAGARRSRDSWKSKHDELLQELAEHRSVTRALRRLQTTARAMS